MTKKQTPPAPSFPRTNYHVVKIGRQWFIKVGGEVIDAFSLQKALLTDLRIHCRMMWKRFAVPSEIHIHAKDGTIRAKDTYGNDPVETKG